MSEAQKAALDLHTFEDRESACAEAGRLIESGLKSAMDGNFKVSIAVAGGTSPGPVFDQLSTAMLDWSRVSVVPTDDRWVPADNDASNEKLVRSRLLQNNAAAATFFPLVTPAATPEEGEQAVATTLEALPMPLSVVLLGMGPDGHFASAFPNAEGLEKVLTGAHGRPNAAIKAIPSDVTGDMVRRMSLTMPTLLDASVIVFLIFGDQKKKLVEKVIARDPSVNALPIAAFNRAASFAGKPIQVIWAP